MASSQEQSILFKLSDELRIEIYRFCAGFLETQRLLSSFDDLHQSVYRAPGYDLNLLHTCKRIYNEAKPIVQTFATLSLNGWLNPTAVTTIPAHIHGFLPFKLSLVRDLQIELRPLYWCGSVKLGNFLECCEEDLEGLRIIRVCFEKYDSGYGGYGGGMNRYKSRMISSQKQAVQDLTSFVVASRNLRTITCSGYLRKEVEKDLEYFKNRISVEKPEVKVQSSLEAE